MNAARRTLINEAEQLINRAEAILRKVRDNEAQELSEKKRTTGTGDETAENAIEALDVILDGINDLEGFSIATK